MTVYLIRHAQAGSRRAAALPDDRLRPLTTEGRHQAAELASLLADILGEVVGSEVSGGSAQVLTSPYRRCVETAAPIAAALGLEAIVTAALEEGPADEAIALVRAAPHGTVIVSHGDIIPSVLEAVATEDGVDLGPAPRCQKASVWMLEPASVAGRFATASYVGPPSWAKS